MKKLNSMRRLESLGLDYRVHAFDPAIRSARGVAEALGISSARVFKSLIALDPEGRICVAVLGAEDRLDAKALARSLGVKKVRMASKSEAEQRTGMKTGGISALDMDPRTTRVILDRAALASPDPILVSAGRRGCNLEMSAETLIAATGAEVADIASHGNTP